MEIRLHKFQQEALFSKKRVTSLVAGKQGGKTFVGSLWLRLQTSLHKQEDACFLVTAPTHKILKQATLPRFLNVFSGLGELNSQDMVFTLHTGHPIYIRTLSNPNAIEGIAGCRGIWADEAGQYKQLAWDNLQGRAAPKEAPIFITTTPYALNWLYRDLYKPWCDGKRPDVHFVQFRSIDNPHFPRAEFERLKSIMDPRRFAMDFEGQFQRMAGLVFMDFEEALNLEDPFIPNPRDYYICAGVDWGYTNAFAIAVRAIHKTEVGRDYQIAEFYQSYLTMGDKVQVAQAMAKRHGIQHFYCDNEEPAAIAEFNKAGLSASACKKYPGSLKDNIARHNQLIKTREHKVFRGRCPHTLDEYSTYHYPEPDGDEENVDEEPVDANNHLMTANMYATQGTEHVRAAARERQQYRPDKSHLEKLLSGEFAPVTAKREDWAERNSSGDWYDG